MIGQQGAIWIPANGFTKGWRRSKPHYIIIHGSATSTEYPAAQTARDYNQHGISTHYVVGYDGSLVQCVDEANSAWGNGVISGPGGVAPVGGGNKQAQHDKFWDQTGGDPNGDTISIETARSADNKSPWSQAQTATIYNLVSGIASRWGIPAHYADINGGITGHYSIDPVNRDFCPGPVDWNGIIVAMGGNGMYTVGPIPPPVGSGMPGDPVQQATLWAQAPVAITSSNDAFLKSGEYVHQTLQRTPGMFGIVSALDEAEQFPGIYNAFTGDQNIANAGGDAVMSVMGTAAGNITPFFMRAIIVAMGVALIIGLAVKAGEPLIGTFQAGGNIWDEH